MKFFPKERKTILHRICLIKRLFNHQCPLITARFTHKLTKLTENVCEYPPIIDPSEEGQNRHAREMWYDSMKALPTVEEKLHELAVIQKLDLKTYTLTAVPPTYNGVNFQNFITRTHVISGLPKLLNDINVDHELGEIRENLCELLLNYYCNVWEENKSKKLNEYLSEKNAGSSLANSLISQCFKRLAVRNDYIINSTIQQKPRIFSFWWHGGYGSEEDALEEKNLCFQYEDYATFAIRGKDPLLPILDMSDSLCSTSEIQDYGFHPDVLQIPHEIKSKVASIPGYWPGDPYEFPFLLLLSSNNLKSLTSQLKYFDEIKVENGAAVMSSFAWLNAVATYQGFTPFHDITYPLVTQTIVTNGQDWNFFVYQLNTIAFHNDVDKKDRRNICWSSGKLRLFDTIENGRVKGINDEVFRILLKFLHNAPQPREGVVLKPYLGTETRSKEEILHMRYFLRKMYCRSPGHLDHREEVPTWVKIYKLHPDAPPTPFVRLE